MAFSPIFSKIFTRQFLKKLGSRESDLSRKSCLNSEWWKRMRSDGSKLRIKSSKSWFNRCVIIYTPNSHTTGSIRKRDIYGEIIKLMALFTHSFHFSILLCQ